jgi:FkbM family methyltransferase
MSSKLHYLYRAYRYRLRVDPAELRYVCSKLRPGQTAVDVGCHKGAYTYWMRRRVGSTGRVVAFEPQPRQVEYLRSIFAAMRYDNVTLVPKGLSSAPGELPLHLPEGSGKTHAATFEHGAWNNGHGTTGVSLLAGYPLGGSSLLIPVTTLDEFFAAEPRGPDFLKIDVEGHESAVLEGARHTLVNHRPAVLIECEARHRSDGDVQPVFDLFESLGYKGRFFENGRRRPLADFDSAVHQRIDSDSDRLPRGYVNNFVFESAE